MVAMMQDRWFIWTVVGVVVIGVSTWAYVQYAIIQMDAESLNIAIQVPTHANAAQ